LAHTIFKNSKKAAYSSLFLTRDYNTLEISEIEEAAREIKILQGFTKARCLKLRKWSCLSSNCHTVYLTGRELAHRARAAVARMIS
jgi:hypothetical protein